MEESLKNWINGGWEKNKVHDSPNRGIRQLEVNNYNFKRMANFKYLGMFINKNACSNKEIKVRLVEINKCYFGLIHLFKSKMLIILQYGYEKL